MMKYHTFMTKCRKLYFVIRCRVTKCHVTIRIATKCHFISYHRHHSHHILNVYIFAFWLVYRFFKYTFYVDYNKNVELGSRTIYWMII